MPKRHLCTLNEYLSSNQILADPKNALRTMQRENKQLTNVNNSRVKYYNLFHKWWICKQRLKTYLDVSNYRVGRYKQTWLEGVAVCFEMCLTFFCLEDFFAITLWLGFFFSTKTVFRAICNPSWYFIFAFNQFRGEDL